MLNGWPVGLDDAAHGRWCLPLVIVYDQRQAPTTMTRIVEIVVPTVQASLVSS